PTSASREVPNPSHRSAVTKSWNVRCRTGNPFGVVNSRHAPDSITPATRRVTMSRSLEPEATYSWSMFTCSAFDSRGALIAAPPSEASPPEGPPLSPTAPGSTHPRHDRNACIGRSGPPGSDGDPHSTDGRPDRPDA